MQLPKLFGTPWFAQPDCCTLRKHLFPFRPCLPKLSWSCAKVDYHETDQRHNVQGHINRQLQKHIHNSTAWVNGCQRMSTDVNDIHMARHSVSAFPNLQQRSLSSKHVYHMLLAFLYHVSRFGSFPPTSHQNHSS